MKKKVILIFCAAVGLILVGYGILQGNSKSTVTQADATSATAQTESSEIKSTAVRPSDVIKRTEKPTPEQLKAKYAQFMANRPAYLDNIDLPGRYSVDEDGNLIVDEGVKEMLDFFLQGIGDLSFDEMHDLIAGSMITSLQEPALSQALELLENYFTYLDAYDDWQKSFNKDYAMANDPASLQSHMQQLADLRTQYLGEEAHTAFFGEIEQVNAAYLDAQIALQQPNLTESEKAAIRDELKQSLPPHVREAQEASMTLVTLTETTSTLKQQGASDADIYQARVEMVGEEAAQRLAQVDEEKRVWNQKRNQYKSLIQQTPGLGGMTDSERTNYIADLAQRELGLSSNEIKRMQALDRIEAAESIQ